MNYKGHLIGTDRHLVAVYALVSEDKPLLVGQIPFAQGDEKSYLSAIEWAKSLVDTRLEIYKNTTKQTEAQYHRKGLERQIDLCIDMAKAAKPNDRSDQDRYFAVFLTDIEKLRAYYLTYCKPVEET